jgi:FkbM family methyltransferase
MFLKRIIYSLLGPKKYLQLISTVFLLLYRTGLLRKRFPQHYFISNLVREGNTVIDIGANLGYYSIPLSLLCGKGGKVIAVEPVRMFLDILGKNTRFTPHANISLIHGALGNEHEKIIQMGTPVRQGVLRHGLTRVITGESTDDFSMKYEVIQYHPDNIFSDLEHLDFIKCDVEGYERYIIPEFRSLIHKYRPVFQIEISERETMDILFRFFEGLDYRIYFLQAGLLHEIKNACPGNPGDIYFLPVESLNEHRQIVADVR